MATFTSTVYTDEFRLVVPLTDEPTDLWTLCMTPFRPFKASAWYWIAATVFYMAWCLDVVEGPPVGGRMPVGYYHFIGKILKDEDGNPESSEKPSMLTKILDRTIGRAVFALYNGLIAFTGGGSHLDGEDGGATTPGKLIKAGFNVFGLIVLTAYTASSAAGLVVVGQRGTIESIDDIAGIPGAKLCVRTAIVETFELRYPMMRGKTLTSDTVTEMLQNVDDGKCVGAMIMADGWDKAVAENPDAHCNKIAVGETLMIVGNGMPIRPEWHMPISFIVAQMVASGKYEELRADYKRELIGEPGCVGGDSDDGGDHRRLLSTEGKDLNPLRLFNRALGSGGTQRHRRLKAGGDAGGAASQNTNYDGEEEGLDGQPILDEMDLFAPLIMTFICSTAGLLCFYGCGYSESCPIRACDADQAPTHNDPETMSDQELLKFIARKLQMMDSDMHLREPTERRKERRHQSGTSAAGSDGNEDELQEPIWPGMGVEMQFTDGAEGDQAGVSEVAAPVKSHHGVQPGDYFEQAMLLQQRMEQYAPVRAHLMMSALSCRLQCYCCCLAMHVRYIESQISRASRHRSVDWIACCTMR